MKKLNTLLTYSLSVSCFAHALIAAEINVSPHGEIKTLESARDEARKLRAGGEKGDIDIIINDGTYVLNKTLILGLEDSAPDGASTTFKAATGASPIISGGITISDWEKTDLLDGKVWKAKVPWAKEDSFFHCLFDGKTLLPRARSKEFVITVADKKLIGKYANTIASRTNFSFPEGVLKSWDNLEDIELYGQPTRKWLVNYLTLKEVNEAQKSAQLKTAATYTISGNWYVENTIEHLDEPGEWVLNSQEGTLYYYPESGAPGDNIIAPALNELIRIEGKNDPSLAGINDIPVKGIAFEGLQFSYADRQKWFPEDKGLQHDWNMFDKANGLIRLRGAENCHIKNCTFSDSGSDGVRMDLYAQNNTVEDSTFKDIGGTAVLLAGYGPGKKDVNKNNIIHNNEITRVGRIFLHSPGVFIWQSGHNKVSNNHIYDQSYSGMVIAGVRRRFFDQYYKQNGMDNPYEKKWSFPEGTREHLPTIRWDEISLNSNSDWNAFEPYMHARGNIIEYNEVHDCLKLLHDGNCIYLSANGNGNIVRYNVTYNHGQGAMIRTDDDSHGATVNQNLLFGTFSGSAICIKGLNDSQHNVLVNSYFLTGKAGNTVDPKSNLSKNVYYHTDHPVVVGYHFGLDKVGEGLDQNVYFHEKGGMDQMLQTQIERNETKKADKNSIASDPKFVDFQNGDFSFKKDSPALKLGIKPLTLETVSKMGTSRDPFLGRFKGKMPLEVDRVPDDLKGKKGKPSELDL